MAKKYRKKTSTNKVVVPVQHVIQSNSPVLPKCPSSHQNDCHMETNIESTDWADSMEDCFEELKLIQSQRLLEKMTIQEKTDSSHTIDELICNSIPPISIDNSGQSHSKPNKSLHVRDEQRYGARNGFNDKLISHSSSRSRDEFKFRDREWTSRSRDWHFAPNVRGRQSNKRYNSPQRRPTSPCNVGRPLERPVIKLLPRTESINDNGNTKRDTKIFGEGKPVDTRAREMQIEKKMRENNRSAGKKSYNRRPNSDSTHLRTDSSPDRQRHDSGFMSPISQSSHFDDNIVK
ncbi:uncharacterized protein LOC128959998 isoform X2 [Oppia nitens]|uniref:uncharacterized protein LOC128959998 isoform X2 n=1 Tax=Oppia nitens TaxID=1686743 RepID=UPI0023DBE6FE|nr:uncharacterized protein LOC128959998 isoform X2 [Oppia nitens]